MARILPNEYHSTVQMNDPVTKITPTDISHMAPAGDHRRGSWPVYRLIGTVPSGILAIIGLVYDP